MTQTFYIISSYEYVLYFDVLKAFRFFRGKMNINSSKNSSVFICLILAIITFAVYYQVCTYDFVNYDDNFYVYENPNVKSGLNLDTVKWAFNIGYASNWHPLTWLSHILDWQLFGSNAGGHHITNLIFHIANTLLLFIVLKQMTNALWQSAFVAALFALHPLHVESVAWISERKDVLSTFFLFLTMWAYLKYVGKPKIWRYLLIVFLFALGLMAKPMLVTLPFLLLLLDYWPLERFGKQKILYLILEKVPLFVLSAASSVITFFAQQKGGSVMPLDKIGLNIRIYNTFISYVEYIRKMFWPSRLAMFYPHPNENISVLYAVISAAVLLIITILIIRSAKRHKYLFAGWFWYLGILLPVIGLVQVGDMALADRYSYISLTGLFIIISWGLPKRLKNWPPRKMLLWVSAMCVLSAFAACSFYQQQHWKNTMTLCENALRVTRNNYKAHFCLAMYMVRQDRYDEAAVECRKYLQIKPDNPEAINLLGVALIRQGRYDEALDYFNKALQIAPNYAIVHDNIGRVMVVQGRYEESVPHLAEAVRLDPDFPSTHHILGQVLVKIGKADQAVGHFEEAIRLKTDWAEPMKDLALLLASSGQAEIRNPDRAVELALRACALTGYNRPDMLDTLAAAYASAGDFAKAVEIAQKAADLCPPQHQKFKEQIEERLKLYKTGKPYVATE
jgi:Tfp pilus assembly protein PilF